MYVCMLLIYQKPNSQMCLTVLIGILALTLISTPSHSLIPLNSKLTPSPPNQAWSSPNLTFSLRFTAPDPPTDPPSFLASIFHLDTVPVWSAGPTVDAGGSLHLQPSGNLRLLNGLGSVVWETNTGGLGVQSAEVQDTGNLVLRNSTGVVWSSFNNPTDTIVPSQNFTVGMVLRNGIYSFRVTVPGNLTLKWNESVVYWTQGLNSSINANPWNNTITRLNDSVKGDINSPVLELQGIGTLTIRSTNLSSPIIVAYSNDYAQGESEMFRFLRLDGDGNLRIYTSIRGGVPESRWAAVGDQCKVFGYCGDWGICSYNISDPVCGCPSQNFEPLDPNDGRKGCRRKKELRDCPTSSIMLELNNTLFWTYPPELAAQVLYMGMKPCSSTCLANRCDASTLPSDGTGLCYLMTPGFKSGYHSPSLPSTSYVKVCMPVMPNPSSFESQSGWRLQGWVVIVVVVATLLGLVALEGGLWWWCCRNSPKFGGVSTQYALLEYASGAPVQFSYKDLHRATKGFKEKLGAGGFGAVYKGNLANRTVVAVKQLEGIEQGEKQFRMEVATISSTHHLNLVRLIGFCSEGRHRLLVYEFMKKGSLDNLLFIGEGQSGKSLNWEHRFNIALGTARGITYLHEECRDCIVHCDIKPENILLDENYNSKVSDFGLAKLINPKDHRYRTLTSVRGTRGYLAPEWIANLPITSKSDIYSYGMVLLEIVSGRRNFEVSADTNHKKFWVWAYEEFEKGNAENIIDKRLAQQEVNMEQARRAIQVSFWCIQEQPSQRPMMGKVVQMLEGIVEVERPPAPKVVLEGPVSGTNMSVSSSLSTFSTIAPSGPAPSASSTSGRYIERASLSLLRSDPNETL